MPEMNDEQSDNQSLNDSVPSGRVDLLDLLFRWRKFIYVNVIIVIVGATVISFLLPKWYDATASILPPKEESSLNPLGAASALLQGVGSSLQKIGSMATNSAAYNYLAILNSRSVMEAVVDKFDLFEEYGIADSSMERAIKELESNCSFEVQEEDYITIDVLDRDPQRAADMANYFVDMLNAVSIRLGTQEARDNREFIEQRVNQVYRDLHKAEDSLRAFQERSQILIVPDENASGLSAVAELYGMKAKMEIEVGVLERTVSSDNPVLAQDRIELQELNKKVAEIPAAGIGTLRLYREVMIQQKILEYVLPLFEQAKVDEHKDVPVILVLDKAVKPERKDKPKRALIIVISALSSLLLSIAYALGSQKLQNWKQIAPKRYELLRSLFHRRANI